MGYIFRIESKPRKFHTKYGNAFVIIYYAWASRWWHWIMFGCEEQIYDWEEGKSRAEIASHRTVLKSRQIFPYIFILYVIYIKLTIFNRELRHQACIINPSYSFRIRTAIAPRSFDSSSLFNYTDLVSFHYDDIVKNERTTRSGLYFHNIIYLFTFPSIIR